MVISAFTRKVQRYAILTFHGLTSQHAGAPVEPDSDDNLYAMVEAAPVAIVVVETGNIVLVNNKVTECSVTRRRTDWQAHRNADA